MTLYDEIVRVMQDGEPRTSREIAGLIDPTLKGYKLSVKASKITEVVARKARIWGEFVEVEQVSNGYGGWCKVWRMDL